jgi:hypothetical protein
VFGVFNNKAAFQVSDARTKTYGSFQLRATFTAALDE